MQGRNLMNTWQNPIHSILMFLMLPFPLFLQLSSPIFFFFTEWKVFSQQKNKFCRKLRCAMKRKVIKLFLFCGQLCRVYNLLAAYRSVLNNMAAVKLWYTGDKCHTMKSTVTWAVICVYKVTFLDWDGLWTKPTWISLTEKQLLSPFPHQKFAWLQREPRRGREEEGGTCGKTHVGRNICRLKSWCILALTQSYFTSFLWTTQR